LNIVTPLRSFLSRIEMKKWLNYGFDSARVRKWNARLIDRSYEAGE